MNDLHTTEKAVLGTLIETNGDVRLPAPLALLLDNAPESFDDMRHQQIAVAIKILKENGKPVHALSVLERLEFPDASTYLGQVVTSALMLETATAEAETIWDGYKQRRTVNLFSEAATALQSNPGLCRSITASVRTSLLKLDDENQRDGLPEMLDAADLVRTNPILPDELIAGLLHRGSKLSLGGSSKAYKSWTFLNIALSLATGEDWLGFQCAQSKVLYVNLEIQPGFLHRRLEVLTLARMIFPDPGMLDIWNLRGYSAPHHIIIPKIIRRTRELGYGLVILDPAYKLFSEGGDENSATDVGEMMRSFENITTQTGASVGFGAHFAKGNASAKEAIDRVSGSGVYARDPDSILTFTKHEEEDCFALECVLRNLPPVPSFVVKWNYPQFTKDESLDPEKLKKIGGKSKTYTVEMIMELLQKQSMTTTEWKKTADAERGIGKSTFFDLLKEASAKGLAVKSTVTNRWSPILKLSPTEPPADTQPE